MSKAVANPNAAATQWGSARAAQAAGGLSAHGLLKLAAAGKIRTLLLPGSTPKYHVGDARAIGKEIAEAAK